MKKLLLPLIILGAGAVGLGRFTRLASEARTSARRCEAEWSVLSNGVARLTAEKAALRNEIKATRQRLSHWSLPAEPSSDLVRLMQSAQSNGWSQAALPELRRRLGITWDCSPDYVLVSKASLKGISLNGVGGQGVLTPTVCDVLAITPEERASLESLVQRTAGDYLVWMKTNVTRMEPSGDVLAKYVIPANPELSQRLMFEGGVGVLGAVGAERTELCRNFAMQWVQQHALLGQSSVSLIVRRSIEGDRQRLEAKCDTTLWGGNSSTGWADLSPASFPDLFRALFPGGWRDLAQRENFALPDDFQDASPAQ